MTRSTRRRTAIALVTCAAAVAASTAITSVDAEARGPRLAALDGFRRPATRSSVFVLPAPTRLEIEAVGAGDRHGRGLLAHAWILDLESRWPVWTQQDADGEWDRRSENWTTRDEVTLPAGTYALYFAAHDGQLPIDAELKILGIQLGRIRGDFKRQRDWDDVGDPHDWGAWVWAADSGFEPQPVTAETSEPYPDAPIRLLGLGDGEMKEVRFDLSSQTDLELRAIGEYVKGSPYFADTAWLVDCDTWERVFTLTPETTEPAGGAEKNRRFAGKIRLEAGSYLLGAATDETHSSEKWNAAPPWDPESWGAALWVADPADRSELTVREGAPRPEPAVAIARVRNDEFESRRFYLTREAKLLVRGVGEQTDDDEEFADVGWIERVSDLDEVWSMNGHVSYPAGGARKNRLVEDSIVLPAGNYQLCYTTDGSHAYRSWNEEKPFDPDFWGITVAEIDPGGDPALHPGGNDESGALLSIAPVGDDQHIVKRFEVSETTRVRLLAIGEGSDGEMHDYAWLADESGRPVWKMEYDETGRAGGAVKNRQIEANLELPAGIYELHYETDGSHAFGDWNSTPPRRPHLWGVTLFELPPSNP
ncbi:MAG: hypothetical protein H6682_08810 [Candidatus Eisenbacteria bacterium]|nr:hypothetical protein [Candidatus Eisenbacteria bacterium]